MKSTARHQVFLEKKKRKKRRKLQEFNMLADQLSSLSVFSSPVWQNQFVETIGFDK